MKHQRYSMSFTTGTLFHLESVRIAGLFLELNDWNTVRKTVIANNALQARTFNTLKRVCREIISRLKTLGSDELDLLVKSNSQEQGYILWLAVCRRYTFIADFASEVLRERHISLKTDLHYADFDFFFNKTSEWHPELDEISPATRKKLRQVLFKILREADLLSPDHTIKAALLSPRFLAAIPYGNRSDIEVFPVFESDIDWNDHEVRS